MIMDFFKSYQKFELLTDDKKIAVLKECVKFYEDRCVEYILRELPLEAKKQFKKEPVSLVVTEKPTNDKGITFGDNVVYVVGDALSSDKRGLFYSVCKCTICAVFLNLFSSTATTKGKKTKFGELASGYFASITNEFGAQAFTQDMMSQMTESLALTDTQTK